MIFGLGADLIDVPRVRDKLRRTEGLKRRVFTSREIEDCESRRRSAEHYAVRFAAKEAFLKAMGTGWGGGYRFLDVEILFDEEGRAKTFVHGQVKRFCEENGICGFHLSVSIGGGLAEAAVVLEKP